MVSVHVYQFEKFVIICCLEWLLTTLGSFYGSQCWRGGPGIDGTRGMHLGILHSSSSSEASCIHPRRLLLVYMLWAGAALIAVIRSGTRVIDLVLKDSIQVSVTRNEIDYFKYGAGSWKVRDSPRLQVPGRGVSSRITYLSVSAPFLTLLQGGRSPFSHWWVWRRNWATMGSLPPRLWDRPTCKT